MFEIVADVFFLESPFQLKI